MNHPTKEALMALLYDELPSTEKAEITQHVSACAICRAQVAEWQNVKKTLNSWKLYTAPKRFVLSTRTLKWAAAAVLMLAIGFGLGRFGSQVDEGRIRSALRAQLRKDVQHEIQAAQEAQRKDFIAMLRDVEEQRIADYAQLRKDLETVAVVADEKLTTTERALSHLNLVAQTTRNTP